MTQVIDADGHVMEQSFVDELNGYMPKGSQGTRVFPPFDHLHQFYLRGESAPRQGRKVGAPEWVDFLDETGIDWTVVYPSMGLGVGRIASEDWAVAACRAYNNWLYDQFLSKSDRIKGVALIPVQDVDAAAEELRRTVTELGMVGAMLPSNGEGLKTHLGAKHFWPIYEEAQSLNCSLSVHGGAHHHFGMDSFSVYYPVNALGHPFGIMVQAAAMISHGIFERFPKLRVAYLEGGASWVPFFTDRLDRSYHEGHFQVDIHGEPIVGPRPGMPDEKPSRYFKRKVDEGNIFVGFDVDDEGLGPSVAKVGNAPFLYASDFPHEGRNPTLCRGEIDELLGREDLSDDDKQAVLSENAKRFYALV